MNARLALALLVLIPFALWSSLVVVDHGYFGFLELALREPWGAQVLTDLTIALVLFTSFAIPDARRRGITIWPYVVLTVLLGSIGALAYVVHREVAALRGTRSEPAAA